MSTATRPRATPAEYLAAERRAEFKHEYDNGVITAMAGASRQHNLIAFNLASVIGGQLRGRPCEAYIGDMRVCVEANDLYTYPDLVVTCEEPRFQDDVFDTLLNPTAIAEVLSPSTEADDRGRKFAHYRRLGSLRDYVLIAQDRPSVERFTRRGELWVLSEMDRLEDVLRLESIGCEIPLSEIYDKVRFDEAEPA